MTNSEAKYENFLSCVNDLMDSLGDTPNGNELEVIDNLIEFLANITVLYKIKKSEDDRRDSPDLSNVTRIY